MPSSCSRQKASTTSKGDMTRRSKAPTAELMCSFSVNCSLDQSAEAPSRRNWSTCKHFRKAIRNLSRNLFRIWQWHHPSRPSSPTPAVFLKKRRRGQDSLQKLVSTHFLTPQADESPQTFEQLTMYPPQLADAPAKSFTPLLRRGLPHHQHLGGDACMIRTSQGKTR